MDFSKMTMEQLQNQLLLLQKQQLEKVLGLFSEANKLDHGQALKFLQELEASLPKTEQKQEEVKTPKRQQTQTKRKVCQTKRKVCHPFGITKLQREDKSHIKVWIKTNQKIYLFIYDEQEQTFSVPFKKTSRIAFKCENNQRIYKVHDCPHGSSCYHFKHDNYHCTFNHGERHVPNFMKIHYHLLDLIEKGRL